MRLATAPVACCLLGWLWLPTTGYAAFSGCDESATAVSQWREIAESHDASGYDHDSLALRLSLCLGSSNPELRDSYAYGLTTGWLRAGLLGESTRNQLYGVLSANLRADDPLLRSFSALLLSEIVRADDMDPLLSDYQRIQLLDLTVRTLEEEDDFRSLTAEQGWVHPVAHLADMLWRFALHERCTPQEARQILDAVRQKAGEQRTGFVGNEGDRLARAAVIVLRRGLLPDQEVVAWIESFAEPLELRAWPEAFSSVEGLNELHNSKLVFRAVEASLEGRELPASLRDALQAVQRLFSSLV